MSKIKKLVELCEAKNSPLESVAKAHEAAAKAWTESVVVDARIRKLMAGDTPKTGPDWKAAQRDERRAVDKAVKASEKAFSESESLDDISPKLERALALAEEAFADAEDAPSLFTLSPALSGEEGGDASKAAAEAHSRVAKLCR